jgi:AraC-like DNA-binding protein
MATRFIASTDRGPVRPVHYEPQARRALDVEVMTAAELRRRVLSLAGRGAERVDFLCLLYVTAGQYTHLVDFELLDCSAGSLVVVQPGQMHRFGNMDGWQGWFLIFRAEVVRSRSSAGTVEELALSRDASDLPTQMDIAPPMRAVVSGAFERLAADAAWRVADGALNALLRHQLQALLIRLLLLAHANVRATPVEPAVLQRFRRFRSTVEREFRRWHAVAPYAQHMGCSPKSLGRATLAVTDTGAKTFLTQRIVLEARRLLVHSTAAIGTISDELGFDEATNFVKFFRRETGVTPGAFRAAQSRDARSVPIPGVSGPATKRRPRS